MFCPVSPLRASARLSPGRVTQQFFVGPVLPAANERLLPVGTGLTHLPVGTGPTHLPVGTGPTHLPVGTGPAYYRNSDRVILGVEQRSRVRRICGFVYPHNRQTYSTNGQFTKRLSLLDG